MEPQAKPATARRPRTRNRDARWFSVRPGRHSCKAVHGAKILKGEAYTATEISRGEQGYYVVSDGLDKAYRMRIRTPDFATLQALPLMAIGSNIADFQAILGSLDYVMPDTDR